MRRQSGFTIVELMVTMIIFLLVISAASQIFTALLAQFKQQSKIAETNIEGAIGLDIMRRDLEHTGHGLPWDLGVAAYQEATDQASTTQNEANFNDGPPNNPARGTDAAGVLHQPGGIRSGDNAGERGTDVVSIKAVNVSNAAAAHKWTYVSVGNVVREWDLAPERMLTDDRAIVLILGTNRRLAVVSSGGTNTFTVRYNAATAPDSLSDANFAPLDDLETRIVYGIADANAAALRVPFNRADYYVRTPGTIPARCAAGTGNLYKATLNHADGNMTELPVLDCVADMQVVYRLDANDDGTIDTDTNDISTLTAGEVRTQLREIRVRVLAHEGQSDPYFNFTNLTGTATCATCMRVGDSAALGRDFDLATITNFRQYRWRVYTIAVQPINLR